jgi:tetratricopeptide (TPR) repeat protein
VSDVLRGYDFEKLESDFKGLGQNEYYVVSTTSKRTLVPTRRETRFSFYLSTMNALSDAENWEAVRDTCEQALIDFPDNPEFISQLAYAYICLADYMHSINTYEKCIQMGYEVEDSLFFISKGLTALGNESRALEILEEIVKRNRLFRNCRKLHNIL